MSFIASAVQSVWSGINAYHQSRGEAKLIKQQAQMQADQIRREAAAQAENQRAQSRAYERRAGSALLEAANQKFRADEEMRQGEIAQEKANIEQIKGEREAARRSRMAAQEIGEQYAQFAGNGFLVDGTNPNDTFGAIIKSTATESQADISTIIDNAKMSQWTLEEEKRTMQRNAQNSLIGANNSVFGAQSFMESAKDALAASNTTLANAESAARDTLKYAKKAARRTRRMGNLALASGLAGGGITGIAGSYEKGWWGGSGSGSSGSSSTDSSGGSGSFWNW